MIQRSIIQSWRMEGNQRWIRNKERKGWKYKTSFQPVHATNWVNRRVRSKYEAIGKESDRKYLVEIRKGAIRAFPSRSLIRCRHSDRVIFSQHQYQYFAAEISRRIDTPRVIDVQCCRLLFCRTILHNCGRNEICHGAHSAEFVGSMPGQCVPIRHSYLNLSHGNTTRAADTQSGQNETNACD